MNKTLVFISVILLFSSCGETNNKETIDNLEKRNANWCWFVDGETGIGEWIPIGNERDLPDGGYTHFYCDGGIHLTGKIKNNEDCDTIFYYKREGGELLYKKLNISDTTLEFWENGKFKEFRSNCTLLEEGEYLDNQRIGYFKRYNKEQVLVNERIYNKDTVRGVNYYDSGIFHESWTMVNDSLDGEWLWKYENGNVRSVISHENGKRDGVCLWYHENGEYSIKTFYQKGMLQGQCTWYHENGKLEESEYLRNDTIIGLLERYYDNGQLERKAFYVDGEEEGEEWQYYRDGQLKLYGFNISGKFDYYKKYDEEGSLTKDYNAN